MEIEQLKEANETWRKRWASERYEVEQLKAQVNCLREVLKQLAKLGNGDKYGNSIGNTIAINALAKTPEQCLAEVKAKAIEEYKQEQAEMKQMELATKLMVSSI